MATSTLHEPEGRHQSRKAAASGWIGAASLAIYGAGYVARPIGAFVLGHIGDTHGRKNVLVWCMFLLGFSTIAVGLLPTYDQIGLWAPFLLVVCRLVQGFTVAGDVSNARETYCIAMSDLGNADAVPVDAATYTRLRDHAIAAARA